MHHEPWTLKKVDTRRLEAFGMFCYRRILRVSWTEHRTNISVLREIGEDRCFISSIMRQKLQYFGHITRAGNLSRQTHKEGSKETDPGGRAHTR